MTHYFDFRAELKNGDLIEQRYKGKSSRHKRVTQLILGDLFKLYRVRPTDIENFYLKPITDEQIRTESRQEK
jgi:hypothetical protein